MAFPYVPYDWNPADVLTEARMDNLESQFQSILDLLTNRGDISYRGAATWERLAKGAQYQSLLQGVNDPYWGNVLTVAETEVHAAAAPTTWTDLDLSAILGVEIGPAIVMLKFTETADVSNPLVAVRKNGDTDEFFVAGGIACGEAGQNSVYHVVLLSATDADGVVEWRAQAAGAMTVDVIAYIH